MKEIYGVKEFVEDIPLFILIIVTFPEFRGMLRLIYVSILLWVK